MFGNMKPLSLDKVNMVSPYEVTMEIAIIDNFFEVNTVALLYICETGDRKQAMRNRLFESWFAYANEKDQYLIMVANIHDMENVDNYAALIIRKDNPYFVEYVSEFNKTVNMFRVKPD